MSYAASVVTAGTINQHVQDIDILKDLCLVPTMDFLACNFEDVDRRKTEVDDGPSNLFTVQSADLTLLHTLMHAPPVLFHSQLGAKSLSLSRHHLRLSGIPIDLFDAYLGTDEHTSI